MTSLNKVPATTHNEILHSYVADKKTDINFCHLTRRETDSRSWVHGTSSLKYIIRIKNVFFHTCSVTVILFIPIFQTSRLEMPCIMSL